MDFNDTSDLTGIIQDVSTILSVTLNAYKIEDRTRSANSWYQRLIMDAIQAANWHEWRDTSVAAGTDNSWTTSADGTAVLNLSASTRSYELPTTNKVWFLRKVAFSYDGGVTYKEAKPFNVALIQNSPNDSDIDNNVSTSEPMYRWVGNQLEVYPLPDTNSTNGIKIWFVAQPKLFVDTDTTKQPEINSAFHKALSLGISYDWAMSRDKDLAGVIRTELEQVRQEIRNYYSSLIDENYQLSSLKTRYE